MKKYVKPELYYESFELSQHIAGDCHAVANHNLEFECTASITTAVTIEGLFEKSDVCMNYEMYCYTQPTMQIATFYS